MLEARHLSFTPLSFGEQVSSFREPSFMSLAFYLHLSNLYGVQHFK